jgi:hypothetical protein
MQEGEKMQINRISMLVGGIVLLCQITLPRASFAQIGAAAERAAARSAVVAAERQAAERAAKGAAAASAQRAAKSSADRVVRRWTTSLCKPSTPCPLPEKIGRHDVGASYVGGSYDEVILGQETVLYRAYHDPKLKFGEPGQRFSFWTRSNEKGTQAVVDSAIPVTNSGNTAERVVAVRLPKGARVYEGQAAAIERGPAGGGNQIIVENVKPEWEFRLESSR